MILQSRYHERQFQLLHRRVQLVPHYAGRLRLLSGPALNWYIMIIVGVTFSPNEVITLQYALSGPSPVLMTPSLSFSV